MTLKDLKVGSSGMIRAVGGDAEILALARPGCRTIDCGGRTVVPGFNDSHMHLLNYGYYKTIVDLEGCRSHDEFKKRIKDFIEEKEVPAYVTGNQVCFESIYQYGI